MRVTIIPADNTVTVDGDTRQLVGFVFLANVSAIQWDGNEGQIERTVGAQEHFRDFSLVDPMVRAHAAVKAAAAIPAAVPFATAKASYLVGFRADRENMIRRLSVMAGMAQRSGKPGRAAACDRLCSDLLALTSQPTVAAATGLVELKAAMDALYKAAVKTATDDPAAPGLLAEYGGYDR